MNDETRPQAGGDRKRPSRPPGSGCTVSTAAEPTRSGGKIRRAESRKPHMLVLGKRRGEEARSSVPLPAPTKALEGVQTPRRVSPASCSKTSPPQDPCPTPGINAFQAATPWPAPLARGLPSEPQPNRKKVQDYPPGRTPAIAAVSPRHRPTSDGAGPFHREAPQGGARHAPTRRPQVRLTDTRNTPKASVPVQLPAHPVAVRAWRAPVEPQRKTGKRSRTYPPEDPLPSRKYPRHRHERTPAPIHREARASRARHAPTRMAASRFQRHLATPKHQSLSNYRPPRGLRACARSGQCEPPGPNAFLKIDSFKDRYPS